MEDSVNYFGLDDKSRKYIDNFVVSICDQLLNKKITIDEAFASIKFEFTVAKPVENLYGMVLEVFKNLYGHLTVNATEEIEENFKLVDHNHEEFYHRLNIELMKLTDEKKWVGVFHSQEHYEAFKHILESFEIEEHSKTLFSGFWYEFGGNRKLIRCTAKKYTEWVYDHYLPNEEKKSENLTRSHCGYSHHYRVQMRRYKATYKDQDIFKEPAAR